MIHAAGCTRSCVSFLKSLVAMLVVVGAALAAPARAGTIIAANFSGSPSLSSFDYGAGFTGSTSNGFYSNEATAQEFTAQQSGVLGQIVATVDQFQPEGVSLIVTVLQASGSVPGTELGSLTFFPNQVSSVFSQPSTFDFSSLHLNLSAGHNYFVEFSVTNPIDESVRYRAVLLNTPNVMAFGFPALDSPDMGMSWKAPNPLVPNEIGLQLITANAVPEPTSFALMTIGLGLACLPALTKSFRRRQVFRRLAGE